MQPSHPNNPLDVIEYFATSLYDKQSEEEIYWDIAKHCIHRLGLVDCVIYRKDQKRNVMVQMAAYGNKNPKGRHIFNLIDIPLGHGIVGTVAQSGEPEVIVDTTKDDRYIVDDMQRRSEVAVPILMDGKVIGVIDSEHPEVGFFTDFHLQIFKILAALCSQKIQTLKKPRKKLTDDNKYYCKALKLMETEEIFEDPDMSLQKLSNILDISSTYLSCLINDVTGRNFSDFVNAFRVKAIKNRLGQQEYSHYTLVSIGLEAGFNSKSSFYSAFKKLTGVTPSQYRKNL